MNRLIRRGVLGIWAVTGLLGAQTLTLKEAVAKTLAHHPDVKTFMLKVQQAEQGYNVAYADYLPQIDLSAIFAPTQTFALPVNGEFRTVDETAWNASVTLRQKVWDFQKTTSLIEASKIDEDIAKLSLGEIKALLAYKVKTLYETLVVQKEAIAVRQKDLETKRAFYRQALTLVKQGLKTQADASRFLASVYAAEDALASAKAAYDKALVSLSLYMGVNLPRNLTLEKSSIRRRIRPSKSLEREVLEKNFNMRMSRRSVEKNRLLYKASEAAHFGSLNLVASHTRNSSLNNYNTDYIGLSYNIPLFHGGKLTAEEQRAKIGYRIARERIASETLALKEELRGLMIDIRRYEKTIRAKKAQLASAQKSQRVLEARYKEGLATYIELLESTTQVLVAKLGILEAYYSRSLAIERIDYLKGNR